MAPTTYKRFHDDPPNQPDKPGDYLVNWSPKLQTAVSDLEVEYQEVEDGCVYKPPRRGSFYFSVFGNVGGLTLPAVCVHACVSWWLARTHHAPTHLHTRMQKHIKTRTTPKIPPVSQASHPPNPPENQTASCTTSSTWWRVAAPTTSCRWRRRARRRFWGTRRCASILTTRGA